MDERRQVKTSEIVDLLRERLCHPKIRTAFVFGSVARGTENAYSDIDLMVIGDADIRQVVTLLSGVGLQVAREVNPYDLSVQEFLRRRDAADHFLTTVLGGPKLFIIGTEHDLETMEEPHCNCGIV